MKYKKEFIQTVKDIREIIHGLKKKNYYKDLLDLFMRSQFSVKDGLSQRHLRFLLMEKHGLKDTREMVEFCKRYKFLFKSFPEPRKNSVMPAKDDVITAKDLVPHLKYLRKGNIKNEDDLDKYLKHLRKHNIIKPTNRKKPLRYKLTLETVWGYHLLRVEDYLEQWEPGFYRFNSYNSPFLNSNGERFEDLFLHALPYGLKFTVEEFTEIEKYLKEVRQILWHIVKIKNKKIQHLLEGKDEEERAKLTSIDFFYHGSHL